MTMWQNYLKVAVRALARHKAYAFVNILGLALGLAACLTILTYIRYESGYDRWLPGSGRTHQIQSTWHEPGQPVSRSQNSPFPLRDRFAAGFPEVEALSVMRTGQTVAMLGGQPVFLDAAIVDPAFFDIFKLDVLDGKAALPDMSSVVLTESEAIRLTGTAKAAGRTVTFGAGAGRQPVLVTGVIRDLPKNSSLKLGVIFRHNPADFDNLPASAKGWGNMNQQHYVKLKPGADAAAINAALPAWEKRTIAPQMIDGRPASQADILDLKLVPIAGVHLGDADQGALVSIGDQRTLATFGVVALLILGMAVMNFVNLSTARASLRAREMALRKMLGATRAQLVAQLLGESLLMAAIAMLLALAAVEVATPWIGERIGAGLRIGYLGEGGMLVPALGLLVAAGLLGGLYPALYLSRFQPAAVLRANAGAGEAPGSARLRTALVILQFAIAIGLIASTSIIYWQTRYVETIDPGFRRDGLVQIDSAWRFAGNQTEYEAARREMLAIPGVVAAGRTGLGLAATNKSIQSVRAPGAPEGLSIGVYGVDPDFFRTLDLRLIAGRFLGDSEARDRMIESTDRVARDDAVRQVAARGLNIVINRNAATLLGHADPGRLVGKTVRMSLGTDDLVPATVVGVVEDTRIRTARDAIEPLVYTYDPDRTYQVLVRYAAARPRDVMDGLARVWRKFEPEIPFQGRFAEDVIAEQYAAERGRGLLFAAFSGLAVLIACLGLYSLASFTTERRTKEIGIRKVLGAKVRDIVRLLAWQFSKPVIVANLVAWPVAWWAMRDWLNTFDARIPLGPGPFVLAGVLALAIAVATVAGHALRVARLNPIHALRYE
jgi:putative ABC transport system permease protein